MFSHQRVAHRGEGWVSHVDEQLVARGVVARGTSIQQAVVDVANVAQQHDLGRRLDRIVECGGSMASTFAAGAASAGCASAAACPSSDPPQRATHAQAFAADACSSSRSEAAIRVSGPSARNSAISHAGRCAATTGGEVRHLDLLLLAGRRSARTGGSASGSTGASGGSSMWTLTCCDTERKAELRADLRPHPAVPDVVHLVAIDHGRRALAALQRADLGSVADPPPRHRADRTGSGSRSPSPSATASYRAKSRPRAAIGRNGCMPSSRDACRDAAGPCTPRGMR